MTPPKATRRAEGRGRPEGSSHREGKVRTQGRGILPANLRRVNDAAKKDKRTRFTALLHHVDVAALERAFRRVKRKAAPGVDGETVESYEEDLQERLRGLCDRVHRGSYRPQPVRRVYIPKAGGGLRPIGVPALEDKVVQGAVAEVLSAIYEADFLGFSYGFRPGRNPHGALQSVHTAVMTQYVNWVLDADIRSFFDSVDHEWMLRMVAHRVADRRMLQLIGRWLRAGVMGFQNETDAREMLVALRERLGKFKLALHGDKTRLIEFGKLVAEHRRARNTRRPGTFSFLGFTHYCGWSRDGRFVVKRRTEGRRVSRKLQEVQAELRRRMHTPVQSQHRWLCSVLRGHDAYYGLPSNWPRLDSFHDAVRRRWYRVLRRRSQRRLTWERFNALLERFPLPSTRITHPREVSLARVG